MIGEHLSQVTAVSAIVALLLATLAPLRWRPKTIIRPAFDRAAAFAFAAFLVVWATTDHRWIVGLVVTIGAAASEALQLLTATRHARVKDALAKATGAGFGALLALLTHTL